MAAEVFQMRALEAPLEHEAGALAARASRGPRATAELPSVSEVYEANFKYVWRCLWSLGVRKDVMDDAVQDVFIVVQGKLRSFDPRAQLRTWLYAIALRVARRYRASHAKEASRLVAAEPGGDADEIASDTAQAGLGTALDEAEQRERLDLARRALAALDDAKREVFVLACVEELSAPEIAEITGVPLNTVYSRLRAARLGFAAQVERLQVLSRGRCP